MGKIRIDNVGHFYLDEYDIGPFVVSYEIDGEFIVVKLIGDMIFDGAPPKKPRKKRKKVSDG